MKTMANKTARKIIPTTSFHKTHEEILQMLTLLNARSAMKGKPCPLAARIVEQLEQASGC